MAQFNSLNNAENRRLRGIGHYLKPIVTVGNNGITEAVLEEINRALNDHELIKIKLPAGSKQARDELAQQLANQSQAILIHSIGRMALLLRHNPNANPNLSNLIRYSD